MQEQFAMSNAPPEDRPSPRLRNFVAFPPDGVPKNLLAQIFPGTDYLRHVANLALGNDDTPFAQRVTGKRQNGA